MAQIHVGHDPATISLVGGSGGNAATVQAMTAISINHVSIHLQDLDTSAAFENQQRECSA